MNLIHFLLLLIPCMGLTQIYEPAYTVSSKKLVHDFIDRAMQYPEDAIAQNIRGKVSLLLKINEDGIPYDIRTQNSLFPSLDKEAIRLASKILWHPAKKNGHYFMDDQTMTITFNPKHYQRLVKERGYDAIPENGFDQDLSGKIYSFTDIDIQPEPLLPEKGIMLQKYIYEQLNYPEAAKVAGIEGKVRLDFIVETDGIVSNIQVANSIGGGCDNEAIRILQGLRWKPGRKNDTSVRCSAYIEVTFKLEQNRQIQITNRQSTGL